MIAALAASAPRTITLVPSVSRLYTMTFASFASCAHPTQRAPPRSTNAGPVKLLSPIVTMVLYMFPPIFRTVPVPVYDLPSAPSPEMV